MEVTYIYHSCYIVELDEIVLVFDYFKGDLPEWEKDKKVFFFVSHKHQDHFTLKLFEFTEKYKDVTFVLSKDIKFTDKYLMHHKINPTVKERIVYVGKDVSLELELVNQKLRIETLRSTDEGVAFLITYNNTTIYHAGDLNWWSWSGLPETENADMAKRYMQEIDKLEGRKIDVAFVVLDPRQEERYWWGMDYFLKKTNANVVFPMHCWEKYGIIKQFINEKKSEGYCDRVINVEGEGMHFHIT